MVLPATASVLPTPRIDMAPVDVAPVESGECSPDRQSEGESSGKVLHVFSTGFYLAIDDSICSLRAGHHASLTPHHHDSLRPGQRLLPVMGPEAVQLPFGITVPHLQPEHLTRLRPGVRATLIKTSSAYRIELPDVDINIVREHQPLRLRPTSWLAPDSARVTAIAESLRPGLHNLADLARTLASALHDEDELGIDAGVRALLGRGPGSTPSGDDALCGIALAFRSLGRTRSLELLIRALGAIGLSQATTALSAALIEAAVAGHCVPEAASAIRSTRVLLASGSEDRKLLSSALSALDHIGHSSGHDLFIGFLAVLGLDGQPRNSPRSGSTSALCLSTPARSLSTPTRTQHPLSDTGHPSKGTLPCLTH